jgi:hypothetical protein
MVSGERDDFVKAWLFNARRIDHTGFKGGSATGRRLSRCPRFHRLRADTSSSTMRDADHVDDACPYSSPCTALHDSRSDVSP